MKTLLAASVAAILLLSTFCLAAENKPLEGKPGLWESTSTLEMEGMPNMQMPQIPAATLEKMPPAQRAKVEAMLKQQGGNLSAPHTSRSCATKETLGRGLGMGESKESNCTRQIMSSSGSQTKIHIECSPLSGAGTKTVGDMVMDRVDADHFKGTMVMKSMQEAKTVNMKISFTSKWLGSDCGGLKPGQAK